MGSKYKVSFEVEGDNLGDDVPLDEGSIEDAIMDDFDDCESSYYHHRGMCSTVSSLKVEEMKGGVHNGTIKKKSG